MNKQIKDFLTTIGIMALCFSFSLLTDQMSRTDMLIPMFFVLSVFLISAGCRLSHDVQRMIRQPRSTAPGFRL